MPNEFVARNGIIALNNSIVTGSLNVTAGITGSLFGTSSHAVTASFFGGSISTATSASYASSSTSASYALNAGNSISSSFATNAGSASYALNAGNAQSSSFASTASSADNFTVRNTLTATTIVVQTITSSVNFVTGSTRFGTLASNTHVFTGSVSISGSLTVQGAISGSNITGSLLGTASYASNALSSSYAVNAGNAISASWAPAGAAAGISSYIATGSVSASLDVSSTQTFRIISGSSTFVQVNNAGNVGIGTTVPQATLHISGVASGVFEVDGAGVNGSNAIYVSSSGNIGMGTNTPIQKLHIQGVSTGSTTVTNINQSSAIRIDGNLSSANRVGISYQSGGGGGSAILFGRGGSFDTDISFYTNPSSTTVAGAITERMTINSTGNVGIGATNPSVGRLQINTSAASNNALTFQATSQTAITYGIGIDASSNFAIYDNFSTAQRITMNGSGNIGIGTTSPGSVLDVRGRTTIISNAGTLQLSGSDHTYIELYPSNSVGRQAYIGFPSAGSKDLNIVNESTTGTLNLFTNGSTKVTILANGNVGINTTAPAAKLDIVQGSIYAGTNTATEGTIILQDQYSSGHLTNFGTNRSSGGPVIGYGVYPSAGTTNAFSSSTTITAERAAFSFDGSFRWYTGGSQTVSIGAVAALTQRMVLDNNGNLGIGTSTPQYRLQISGSLGFASGSASSLFADRDSLYNRIYEPAGNVAMYIGNASDPGNYYDNTNHYFRSRGAGTTYANINTNGNLGIGLGATFASAKLHISASSNNTLRIESQDNSDTNPTVYIEGNKGGSSPYMATLIELRSNTEFRGKGIHMTTSGSSTRWFAGVPYNFGGSGYQIGYDGTANGLPYTYESASLFINTSGNVGIGTTSPLSKLQVNGAVSIIGQTVVTSDSTEQIVIRTATDNNRQLLLGYNQSGNYGAIQAIQQGTAYRDLALNALGGNVGIGTATPNGRLEVWGGTLATAGSGMMFSSQLTTGRTGTYEAGTLGSIHNYFDNNSIEVAAGSSAGWISGVSVTGNNAATHSGTIRFTTVSAERMRITNAGNVGIGMTSPNYRLVVSASVVDQYIAAVGPAPSIALLISQSGSPFAGTLGLATTANHFTVGSAGGDLIMLNRGLTSGSIIFGFGSTERVRITPVGNVGIGTTSPSEELHVYGDANATVATRIENINAGASAFSTIQLGSAIGGNPNRWLNIGYSSVGVAAAGPYHPTGSFIINYGNGGLSFMTTGSNAGTSHIKFFTSGSQFGTERMRIEEAGNIGINLGSTTASARLHVSGTIKTDQPSGGSTVAGAYRWGSTVVTSGLSLLTTRYIEVDIDGTIRRVALVA
jgi:hypothetical protein